MFLMHLMGERKTFSVIILIPSFSGERLLIILPANTPRNHRHSCSPHQFLTPVTHREATSFQGIHFAQSPPGTCSNFDTIQIVLLYVLRLYLTPWIGEDLLSGHSYRCVGYGPVLDKCIYKCRDKISCLLFCLFCISGVCFVLFLIVYI